MPLKNLYLLRILQINVYASLLQQAIMVCKNPSVIGNIKKLQNDLYEERKQIRSFLNVVELWSLKNA